MNSNGSEQSMSEKYRDECDSLDASIFNGEMLSEENIDGFKFFLLRWLNAVEQHEAAQKQ